MMQPWFGARLRRAGALGVALCALGACGDKRQDLQPTAATGDKPAKAAELKYGLSAAQAAQVLVKVGDTSLTLGDFAERLGGQSPYLRARYNSPERRREFLDNMVRFELLAIEAKKRGFDRESDVDRVQKQMMVQQMMQELFEQHGVKLADITDAEVAAYYAANKSEFDKPEQVRASEILLKNKAAAEAVLTQVQAAPDDMQLFRKLAETHNQNPQTKSSFGDLRYFSEKPDDGESPEPARPVALRKAAFTLKNVGEVYPGVIQSELGFHVLKLTGRRDPLKRSLEDARRLIQSRLWRQKREEAIDKFVAELRSKAKIKESPELLSKVHVNADKAGQEPVIDSDHASDEAVIDAREEAAAKKALAEKKAPADVKAKAPGK